MGKAALKRTNAPPVGFLLFMIVMIVVSGFAGYSFGSGSTKEKTAPEINALKEKNLTLALENFNLKEKYTGNFVGIGIEYHKSATTLGLWINSVYEGTPAAKVGMRVNDIILGVNYQQATETVIRKEMFLNQNMDLEIKRGDRILQIRLAPIKLERKLIAVPAKKEEYVCTDCNP